jgi:hypothetical protein
MGMLGDEAWGSVAAMEPYATTSIPFPVPLAQFKLAVVGGKDEDGNPNNTVTFTTEDSKEAFYYMQVGVQMADQGFVVEVTDDSTTATTAPADPGI